MLEKTEGAVKNGQSRDNANIGYTKHRTKTNKAQKHNTESYKKMSNLDPTKSWGEPRVSMRACSSCSLKELPCFSCSQELFVTTISKQT